MATTFVVLPIDAHRLLRIPNVGWDESNEVNRSAYLETRFGFDTFANLECCLVSPRIDICILLVRRTLCIL